MAGEGSFQNDLEADARSVGLVHVTDDQPGICRRRRGGGFVYVRASGDLVKSTAVKKRIESLSIPPAYEEVWICQRTNGHLQAVGIDDRGRKQYIYHPDWRAVREANKFDRMVEFGKVLPLIRRQIRQDLGRRGLPKEKVVALLVALLEKTLIRVGGEKYARENNSYGLTTLEDRHLRVRGENMQFRFRGKSGVWHEIDVEDMRLAKVVRSLQELPGQRLFQYKDDSGLSADVSSTDVNAYLHLVAGADFTAKDFRTWQASLLTLLHLRALGTRETVLERRAVIKEALEVVAAELGNTPAVCRKSYVHPCVLQVYEDVGQLDMIKKYSDKQLKKYGGLRKDEARLLCFLEETY